MIRAALYARYSSENQKDTSITDQFRNCETRATREGWTITARYEDKAISGTMDETGRPGYKALLDAAKAKQCDIVLVDDFSRLSRDQVETEQARRRFVHWGVRLIGVSDGIDTADKGHKMLSSFKGIMNEGFLDDLRDKTRRGLVGQVLKGYHSGGRSYGYRLAPEYDPSQKDPYGNPVRIGTRLAIDPEQARWVHWIFERYAEGMSPHKIVDELNRQGVPSPGATRRRTSAHPATWCSNALYGNVQYGLGLLNNRLYIGELTWGRSRWVKDPDTKRAQRVPCEEQDWIRHPVAHLQIVEDALWARVKQRQQEIQRASTEIRTALHVNARTGRAPKYLFSGLLTCGQCGRKFVILDPTRYGCSGWKYRGFSVCTNTTMAPRKLVERLLLEAIQKDLFTAEGQAVFTQEAARLLTAHRRAQKPEHQQATKRLQDVEQEIANIMTAIKAGILTPSTKAALERAEAERTQLLQTVQSRHTNIAKVAAFLPNALGRFTALLDDLANVTQLQVDRARGLLRVLLGNAIVLHPTADGATRYLTAEVSGDYAGLLRLAVGQNKLGCREGQQTSPVRRG